MKITVLLFATLKDLAGQSRLTLQLLPGAATVDTVRRALVALHPQMEANLASAIAAVNEEYAFAQDPIKDGDEVAFFPPVSGGSGTPDPQQPEVFLLADAPVDLDDLSAQITTAATGALCIFSGMVRGETHADAGTRQTEHLEYEAYAPMALAKMRQVAAEIRERYPLVQGIAIMQRIGTLHVGQNTVLIACSSGHRDQGCFEAARFGIDRLKEIVPVWKKEVAPQGASWVEGHYTPTPADKRS